MTTREKRGTKTDAKIVRTRLRQGAGKRHRPPRPQPIELTLRLQEKGTKNCIRKGQPAGSAHGKLGKVTVSCQKGRPAQSKGTARNQKQCFASGKKRPRPHGGKIGHRINTKRSVKKGIMDNRNTAQARTLTSEPGPEEKKKDVRGKNKKKTLRLCRDRQKTRDRVQELATGENAKAKRLPGTKDPRQKGSVKKRSQCVDEKKHRGEGEGGHHSACRGKKRGHARARRGGRPRGDGKRTVLGGSRMSESIGWALRVKKGKNGRGRGIRPRRVFRLSTSRNEVKARPWPRRGPQEVPIKSTYVASLNESCDLFGPKRQPRVDFKRLPKAFEESGPIL